jgi:hypothetical protein
MSFDQPYNQAPSLHIALLVVLLMNRICALSRAPGTRWSMPWPLLIGVSVLTTWQHHFVRYPDRPVAGLLRGLAVPDRRARAAAARDLDEQP